MRYVLAGLVVLFILMGSVSALVYVEPSYENVSNHSDQEFTIDVSITGVDDLYGFQFDVIYNSSVLDAVEVTEGTFLSNNGQDQTYCLGPDLTAAGLIDNYGCSRRNINYGINGTGVIATLKFNLKSLTLFPSTSDIILSSVKTSDLNSQPLDNSSQDGMIDVYECLQGETKSCSGGTQTCDSNNQWGSCDTSGSPPPGPGSSPGGSPSSGPSDDEDDDTGDSEEDYFYNSDLNKDGCVDLNDLSIIVDNLGFTSGFPSSIDMNIDGEIDVVDLVLVALAIGKGSNC